MIIRDPKLLIRGGGGGGDSGQGWQPPPWWPDIKAIMAADRTQSCKYGMVVSNAAVTTTLSQWDVYGYRTSDGAFYLGNSMTHTWDPSKDFPTPWGTGTRWIIAFLRPIASFPTNTNLVIPPETLYLVVDGFQHTNSGYNTSKKGLQAIHYLNGGNISPLSPNLAGSFQELTSLREPPKVDLSHVMFMNSTFLNASAMAGFAEYNVPMLTNIDNCWYGCRALEGLVLHNCGAIGTTIYPFNSTFSLEYLVLEGIRVSWSMGPSTRFSRASLRATIDALANMSDNPEQTLTMGAVNLAKLTPEDIEAAREKKWALA